MPDEENTPTTEEETTGTDPAESGGEGGENAGSESQESDSPMELIWETCGRALTSTMEELDYIDADGKLHLGATPHRVMITSSDDLEALPEGLYPPGSVAFLADESGKWRLDASGTWNSLTADPSEA